MLFFISFSFSLGLLASNMGDFFFFNFQWTVNVVAYFEMINDNIVSRNAELHYEAYFFDRSLIEALYLDNDYPFGKK